MDRLMGEEPPRVVPVTPCVFPTGARATCGAPASFYNRSSNRFLCAAHCVGPLNAENAIKAAEGIIRGE